MPSVGGRVSQWDEARFLFRVISTTWLPVWALQCVLGCFDIFFKYIDISSRFNARTKTSFEDWMSVETPSRTHRYLFGHLSKSLDT